MRFWIRMELYLRYSFTYMRRPGIEPGPPPWQGGIIPLDYRREYSKITSYAFLIKDFRNKNLKR